MIVGSVTPTRGNRPHLLARCKEYIARQTRPVDSVLFVDYEQKTHPVDLTERYRYGLEKLRDVCDVIFLIEDDDYYAPNYVETMLARYVEAGEPDIFGIGETTFYHPQARMKFYREHKRRACAFVSMIKTSAIEKIRWDKIDEVFFDDHAWKQLQGKTVVFGPDVPPLSIGIKHGRGPSGAQGHNQWFYSHGASAQESVKDQNFEWLKKNIGLADAAFYIQFAMDGGLI